VRGDQAGRYITHIVGLGERSARVVGGILVCGVALTIFLDVLLKVFPWYSIIAAFTIIPVLLTLRQATGDLKNYLKLMASNRNGDLQATFLILLALLVRGFTHV